MCSSLVFISLLVLLVIGLLVSWLLVYWFLGYWLIGVFEEVVHVIFLMIFSDVGWWYPSLSPFLSRLTILESI